VERQTARIAFLLAEMAAVHAAASSGSLILAANRKSLVAQQLARMMVCSTDGLPERTLRSKTPGARSSVYGPHGSFTV